MRFHATKHACLRYFRKNLEIDFLYCTQKPKVFLCIENPVLKISDEQILIIIRFGLKKDNEYIF